jgi:hypothetical protein
MYMQMLPWSYRLPVVLMLAVVLSSTALATVPGCGISAQQDVPSSGYDRLTYWAAPTTSWTVIGRFWQGDYVPANTNDAGGNPTDASIDSGTAAMDIDHQTVKDYNAQQRIQDLYNQGGKDYYYAYRMRNQKTSTVVVIEWTPLFIRYW